MILQRAVEAAPSAAGEARAFVRDTLATSLSPSRLDAAELLMSELVTNAVRHSGLLSGDRIALSIDVSPRTVRIDVADAGAGFEASALRPRADGGWGLVLVDTMADRWGTGADAPHSVWFEIDRGIG